MKKGKDGYFRHQWRVDGVKYSVRATTERGLWQKVSEKQHLIADGMMASTQNTPVKKWLDDYLEVYKRPVVSQRTFEQLQGYVKNYIAPNIGSRRLKDIRSLDLQHIINACAGQSESQVRKLRDLVCAAFRQARLERIIPFDPAEGITMPETTSGTHRPITDFEREHILNVCQAHRAGLWVLFMLYTGARPDETRKALWSDIDFKGFSIVLHSSKTDYGDRRVPLPQAFVAQLFAQRGDGYIFTQPSTGAQHTKTSMRQMWESFKRALDIDMGAQTYRRAIVPESSVVAKDLTPYCLRHTYATDLQTAGVPINVAKDLLGHKNISMTARVYTRLSPDAFDAAAEKIAALIESRNGKTVVTLGF